MHDGDDAEQPNDDDINEDPGYGPNDEDVPTEENNEHIHQQERRLITNRMLRGSVHDMHH
jgi:hypothetical protein